MGGGDIYKANLIINYFAANPRQHPLVLTLTMLYNFFVKLMIYHQLDDKSRNNAAAALSVHPFFVNDYSQAAKRYNMRKIRKVIGLIREYDLRLKGVNNHSTPEGELLRELLYKIMH